MKYHISILVLLVLAVNMSAQVERDFLTVEKVFASPTDKGKLGKYKAQKVKGKTSGMGALQLKDGSLYFGDFYDKELHGTGVMIAEDSILYCPECVVYAGKFRNGLKHGRGRCYNQAGELLYEGKFVDDKPVEIYPNKNNYGLTYFTEFGNDEFSFIGEFIGDNPHGLGVFIFNNGDMTLSSFDDGKQDGISVFIQSDGNWNSERIENGVSTPISSSSEYSMLKKQAKENFKSAMSTAFSYFSEALQTGSQMATQIKTKSSNSTLMNADGEWSSNTDGPKSRSNQTSNKYNLSEQQSYNRDKSTYGKYDSMLSNTFAGNRSASASEIDSWQSKMKQLREKWEKKGKSFPHSSNEDK